MKQDPGRGLTERIVTARGRRFRTVVAGSGEPLVVFESGLAAPASMWAEVQRQVSAHTATMSYDRAGHGVSQKAKDGRLFADLNADLEAVLDEMGYDGPLVLVGQSWGGPTVRAMSHVTCRPVAGVVLVDGTNHTAFTPELAKALAAFFRLLGLASRVGLAGRFRRRMLAGTTAGLAQDDADRVKRDCSRGAASRCGVGESAGLVVEMPRMAELEAKGFPSGAAVTFLSATVAEPGNEQMRASFVAAQTADAQTHGARQVLVDTSRHDIHMQQPTLVADEVIAIVTGARA